ncbi:hypothetical protein O3G_MSEX004134 [Manduca sexta]|uniref:SMP-LTD domain-containing protein n=1 Tax=Manduca sexta TaxID=7130 RepID=A0A921YUV8_MANSE|nr:hypothetical protein O3G_MSEX004134 [Manduca sexta]
MSDAMEVSGKSPNTSLSFRYNANNEELEELYHVCEDDPPTPQAEPAPSQSENASPKRGEKTSSIIDKYFKSMRTEKPIEKLDEVKPPDAKPEESKTPVPKEVSSSPMKDYLNRLSKKSTSDVAQEVKEGSNETWKIFHDFKFKIAQAVEDMKTRSVEETKDKSVPRENSISDSEENSAVKDIDRQSVGDTDNQVSSLDSSIQNLSDLTQPLTAKAAERDLNLPVDKNCSESSDDTHKNLGHSDSSDVTKDLPNDSMMEVESGVEALEDNMDGFGDITNLDTDCQNIRPTESNPVQPPPTPTNFGLPPSKTNLQKLKDDNPKSYFFNFSMYFLTFLLFLNYILFPNSNIWNGFLLGIWFFCFASNLKHWLLDNYFSDWEPQKGSFFQLKRSSTMPAAYTIPSVKEHRPLKKYEGWINHYRYPDYDPYTYHINKTTTAFMKLEGCNLRISYTRTKIAKRALWDEKIDDKVTFYQHRLYNLTGARVILLPKGLVRRRQWSKKYPICIILSEKEKIQVLEKENAAAEKRPSEVATEKKKEQQHETESTETNTSPEKKRKFVWRRREKSISHTDGETGKEGLRHRLVKKMHRDKKPDGSSPGAEAEGQVPPEKHLQFEEVFQDPELDLSTKSVTSTKEDIEEELDETELSKIKEFLEEAELETGAEGGAEGEWSVHVKRSRDTQEHLYLFTRTGRDKHEWYRRIVTAVAEANAASAESSTADDNSPTDAAESKDGIEMAVYKMAAEKDTVAFAKASNKTIDSMSEGVTISSLAPPVLPESESYEKNFWPYLFKIIQSHEISFKQTSEAAVMCQIEPSPRGRAKNKKKTKRDSKTPSPDCQCRTLPAEVSWVNTMLARVVYDVMRDPVMIARVQNRIQRKLNTLKLPSFMSPLTVTSLSLRGACPLVQCVRAPALDARGVWLDAELRYDGGAYIALLTQINLMKLKEKNVTLEDQLLSANDNVVENDTNTLPTGGLFSEKQLRKRKPAIYDSEIEDSAESSSDDESPPVQPVDSADNLPLSDTASTTTEGGSSKKKFLRMVDKIATNKYFQQVTDYKYVKRAMEGLSNTDIKLHLEIQGLEGVLALNLPPPPHDRLWIGFRTNPTLVLKARPAVGARTLRFAHISNWIEQKLSKEFEKVLVLPNMEDIILDVMTPTPVEFE